MNEPKSSNHSATGVGGWASAVVLILILAAALAFMIYGWTLTDAQMSVHGYIALVLGVVFSTIIGGGLMALAFYSNRKGYDR